MKKWYWSLALFVVGTVVGSKTAIGSNTNLIVHIAIATVLGFLIGSFLDWHDAGRGRRSNSSN